MPTHTFLPHVGPGPGLTTHELILWYTYVNSGILWNEIYAVV